MIKIIWNAFLLALIALAAAWLSNNSGYIEIEWVGYRIQTSVAVLIGGIVVIYAVFYTLIARPILVLGQKIAYWMGADKRAQKMAKSRINKEVDRYMLLGKGMTALLAGDIPTAQKLKKQLEKSFADDAGKIIVFEAQLAEARNDMHEAMRLYDELAQKPETMLLGMRGKIRLYRLNGNTAKALEIVEKLLTEKNTPAWALSEAFELQLQEKHWDSAIVTLEKARKQDLFDRTAFKRLKASVLLEKANSTVDSDEMEKLVAEAESTDDTLVPAVLKMAEINTIKGNIRKARSQLKRLWKQAPSWMIYEAYLALSPDASALDVVKSVEELVAENLSAPISELALADSSLKARLWGQAKSSLEKYLEIYPESKRALTMMAQVAEANRDEEAVKVYQEKAAAVASEDDYYCAVCLTSFDEWHTVCPICHALGTIGPAV